MRQWLIVGVLISSILQGCAPKTKDSKPAEPKAPRVVTVMKPRGPVDLAAPEARDEPVVMYHVDVLTLNLPLGTISRNEDFWLRLNEQILDPATYDIVQKNGMRVGEAPLTELSYLEAHLAGATAMPPATLAGYELKDLEVEVKKGVISQTIFAFDPYNRPEGRTFDECDNIFNVSFQRAPRSGGELRLNICPMVKTRRKHFQWTLLNEERELEYVHRKHLYDQKLAVNIPLDSFLVIAPAADVAEQKTSIGWNFLVDEEAFSPRERVMLIVPRPYQVGP
jgi:hypothetical protein